MEIKITADKKLLDALTGIAEALKGFCQPVSAPETAAPAKVVEMPAPVAEPAEPAPAPAEVEPAKEEPKPEPAQPAEPVPSRDEIQHLAITKIQGGQRDGVKSLLERLGAARVGEVPDDKLAEFERGLEALA